MISPDLLSRLRAVATDEEIPAQARRSIHEAIGALARGVGDDPSAWRLYRAARDLARGLASVEHVVALARLIARHDDVPLVRKAVGAR